eukprot:TRINITY_DN44914_c0_g1_i1.p2 TRINITY_DN44914_c0_g1~~TRINITY_DN44914_c0_g1_i1.p2  ORF type:complete len:203 (-),score=28.23 TRINITY_DN44914_c0_g1_i1:174-782(-)
MTMLCQVAIPEGIEPGGMFIANTPDGQQVQITCPENLGPGQLVAFNYTPLAAPTATVVGQPVLAGGCNRTRDFAVASSTLDAPPMYVMESVEDREFRQDKQSSELGWIMYFVGWILCCCCGPFGPVFWFGVACIHWSKPRDQREALRQERTVAMCSLATGVVWLVLVVAFLMVVLSSPREPEDKVQGESSGKGDQHYSGQGG